MTTTARQSATADPRLAGKLVFLRHPQACDLAEFTALNRASDRLHRGWVSPPLTAKAFSAYMERASQPNNEFYFICRREDGAIAGAINLSQLVRGAFQNAFLGYYIGAPFARRGYMTEAMRLMLNHTFRRLKLHRVEANIQPGNVASRALVVRAGFRLEGFSPRYLKIAGRWRDHERWAMTAEDWRALERKP